MDDLESRLIAAHGAGSFLKAVYEARRGDENGDHLAAALVAIHNSGAVDVVGPFRKLEHQPNTGTDFFLTASVFNAALPSIEAPVEPVMASVIHLYKAAGSDLAAGMVLEGFAAFSAKDPSRPASILRVIEADPDRYADLLPAALIAGSQLDTNHYYRETIRLLGSGPMELRRRAAFVIGRLAAPPDPSVADAALAALEGAAISEQDGILRASLMKSAVELLQRASGLEARVLSLMDGVLNSGDDYSLHAAAEIFASIRQVSAEVRSLSLSHLHKVSADRTGTLHQIDFGLSRMLSGAERERAVEFIETYLRTHPSLEIRALQITAHAIANDLKLLGSLATRWFLRGDHALRSAITTIVRDSHGRPCNLDVDPSEMQPKDPVHTMFLARKVVGYLFLFPVTATSLVVSLIKQADDDPTLESLGALLYDPLLMSYPGSAAELVKQAVEAAGGKARTTLEAAQKELEDYLRELKSMPDVPALHPSEEQREAHHRRFSGLMARSYKEAQKQSVLLSLVHKSVLLYGDKAVHHVSEPGGQSRRVESPMKTFGASFEFPRLEQIDPVGLDILVRTLKSERIEQ